MADGNHRGWRHILDATRYSIAGLRAALRHEVAFRQELVLAGLGVPLAFVLASTAVERALLISSLFLVLIVELLNSGLEAAIDRFGGERHPLSARAKDLGSAAVFLALVHAVVVWLLVLI